MHDANGKELKKGDVVLVPCVVVDAQSSDDYCNCTLQSVYGRRPDGAKEALCGVNTGVLMRYNKEDTIGYDALDSVRPE